MPARSRGQLGGVTRNAVIGKVHRLGLAGRATPAARRTSADAGRPPRDPPASAADVQVPIVEKDPVVDEHGRKTTVLTDLRPHVQMADRRSVDRRLPLLRPPAQGRLALLRRALREGVPARPRPPRPRARQRLPPLFGEQLDHRP